ncbi:hypothetical protein HHI36_023385 [Cryptolaemus montrouzieri]|uniref:Uncharacterized protein n=1 Tax=Cryptolaemus montrouzieri TaxID=559131 RepID=A0ABD2PG99_9CUCU
MGYMRSTPTNVMRIIRQHHNLDSMDHLWYNDNVPPIMLAYKRYGVCAPKINLKISGKIPNHSTKCSAKISETEKAVTEINTDSLSAIPILKNTKWIADIDIRTVITRSKQYGAKEHYYHNMIILTRNSY